MFRLNGISLFPGSSPFVETSELVVKPASQSFHDSQSEYTSDTADVRRN